MAVLREAFPRLSQCLPGPCLTISCGRRFRSLAQELGGGLFLGVFTVDLELEMGTRIPVLGRSVIILKTTFRPIQLPGV